MFKKDENLTFEEKRSKSMAMLIIYGSIILVAIIIINIGNRKLEKDNEPDNTIPEKQTLTFKAQLDKLKNNYASSTTIVCDSDLLNVIAKKDNDKELLIKEYLKKSNIYYKENNKLYEYINDKIKSISNVKVYNDYDTTFLDIDFIKEIINKENKIDLKEEDYSIARYKISLNDIIISYNSKNNTNFASINDIKVIINLNYDSYDIKGIEMDLSDVYNIIKPGTCSNIKYNIEFSSIGEVSLASLEKYSATD